MYGEDSCCAVACTSPAPCVSDACIGCSPQSSSASTSPPAGVWVPADYLSSLLAGAQPPQPGGDASCYYESPPGQSECVMHCDHPGEICCAYPCAPEVCDAPTCSPVPPSIFLNPPPSPPDACPGSIYYKVSAYPQDCAAGGNCAKAIKIEPQICCQPTYEPCNDLKRDVFVLKIAKKNECEEQTEDLHLELRTPKRHPMGPAPFRADEETQCTPEDFSPKKPSKEKKGKGKKGKGKKKKK